MCDMFAGIAEWKCKTKRPKPLIGFNSGLRTRANRLMSR
nr:MAG TPA: hypothetical protein [Caudoviricetes sp.]